MKNGLFAGKMMVEGPFRQSGTATDLGYTSGIVARLGKALLCSFQ
jgi:hypothetical protein